MFSQQSLVFSLRPTLRGAMCGKVSFLVQFLYCCWNLYGRADFKRLVLCSGIAEMASGSDPTVERRDQPTRMCLWRSEGNCLCFVVYFFSFMTVIFMGRLILGFLSVFVSLLLLILL